MFDTDELFWYNLKNNNELQLLGVPVNYKVHHKEFFYFTIMTVFSVFVYFGLGYYICTFAKHSSNHYYFIYLFYILAFYIFKLLSSLYFIGCIKGNAIKVSRKQFPDVFDILENHSLMLGLKKVPDMYVLQGNGILNAFATRIVRQNFVVLHSDVFEMAYEEGKDAVSFIIGHELGHIKRNHVSFLKSVLIFPAKFIPLLNRAYSRACEYTCDNIGHNLSTNGGVKGLLILTAGKKLYKKIDLTGLIMSNKDRSAFAIWFSELFMTHPHLIKRLAVLNTLNAGNQQFDDFAYLISRKSVKDTEVQR